MNEVPEYRVHNEPSRVEQWRHLVEIVALIGAAVWAVYVFVYQERLKPASEAPELQPSVAVHHEMVSGGNEFVKVDFDIKNDAHVPAMIDGLVVNVYGTRVLLYSYFDVWKPFGAPASKRFSGFPPGQFFRESFVFGIKPGSYNVAKIVWTLCYSPDSDRVFGNARVRRGDGRIGSATRFAIYPRSIVSGSAEVSFFRSSVQQRLYALLAASLL